MYDTDPTTTFCRDVLFLIYQYNTDDKEEQYSTEVT